MVNMRDLNLPLMIFRKSHTSWSNLMPLLGLPSARRHRETRTSWSPIYRGIPARLEEVETVERQDSEDHLVQAQFPKDGMEKSLRSRPECRGSRLPGRTGSSSKVLLRLSENLVDGSLNDGCERFVVVLQALGARCLHLAVENSIVGLILDQAEQLKRGRSADSEGHGDVDVLVPHLRAKAVWLQESHRREHQHTDR